MTKVFYASTLFSAMGLVAALDAGLFGPRDERRVLIASHNTGIPEVSEVFADSAAFVTLQQRFDEIIRWNDYIAPLHPSAWFPTPEELPLHSRALLRHLAIEDGISELVLESIAVAPAKTIGSLIPDCPITVFSDGLMSYGPTRETLPNEIGRRPTRLLYLDLVDGVRPLLLRENEVDVRAIPDSAFLKVVAELPQPAADHAQGLPVIIGQYLSQLKILSAAEETELHGRMLSALVAAGHRRVVFKPHPAAGRAHTRAMQDDARRLGVELTVAADPLPAEAWFAVARPELVVSCFSTALLTGSRYFGARAATVGADLVLTRLQPYENSNRIPASIIDATVPALRADGTLENPPQRELADVLDAVAYGMQPYRNPDLRARAIAYLAAPGAERYLPRSRQLTLGLTPVPPWRLGARLRVRRVARRGYVAVNRLLERARRRVGAESGKS